MSSVGLEPEDITCSYLGNLLLKNSQKKGKVDPMEILSEMMQIVGKKPGISTMANLLLFFTNSGDEHGISTILDLMKKQSLALNLDCYNLLIKSKKDDEKGLAEIRGILAKMESVGFLPDTDTYNMYFAKMSNRKGKSDEISKLIQKMQTDNIPLNVHTFNYFMMALILDGKLAEAESVVERMFHLGFQPSKLVIQSFLKELFKKKEDIQALERVLPFILQHNEGVKEIYTILFESCGTKENVDKIALVLTQKLLINPEDFATEQKASLNVL